jgi:hypothetical protein
LCEVVADAARAGLDAKRAEAEYVYRVAIVARAATGRRLSGMSALEACARSLGLARRTLQQLAIIAMRWTVFEYRALLERQGAGGHSLTTSHLLMIAPLARGAREHWIERTLAEGLEVRELRERIAHDGGPSDGAHLADRSPI